MTHGTEVDESSIFDQSESNCRNQQFLEFHLRLRGAIELGFLKLLSPKHQLIESKDRLEFDNSTQKYYNVFDID